MKGRLLGTGGTLEAELKIARSKVKHTTLHRLSTPQRFAVCYSDGCCCDCESGPWQALTQSWDGSVDQTSLPSGTLAAAVIRKHPSTEGDPHPPPLFSRCSVSLFLDHTTKESSLLPHPKAVYPRFSLIILHWALAEPLSSGPDTLSVTVPTGPLAESILHCY